MQKGVVIYQVALLTKFAEKALDDIQTYFCDLEGVKIDAFYLQEVTPENIKHVCVKITSLNLMRSQIAAMPIFRYFNFLDHAMRTLSENEIAIAYVEPGEHYPVLRVGKNYFLYTEIF